MRHRHATSILVDLEPDDVTRALSQPALLAALNERLADATVEADEETVLVDAPEARWDIRVRAEEGGTRVVVGEETETRGGLLRRRRSREQVEELESDVHRLRDLLEAMKMLDPAR